MAEGFGREPGGIRRLVDLSDEHPAAFAYDWRTRFGRPFSAVGESMTWCESALLFASLLTDPSSHIAAAVEGWENPITREALILMDLFDLDHAVAAGKHKPKPHPGRPFRIDLNKSRKGNSAGRSVAEVKAILAAHGHAPV